MKHSQVRTTDDIISEVREANRALEWALETARDTRVPVDPELVAAHAGLLREALDALELKASFVASEER